MVADFELGFGQTGEEAAVEQLGFEAAPEGFGVGVVIAVAALAHAGHGPVPGQHELKASGRVLAALVGAPRSRGLRAWCRARPSR